MAREKLYALDSQVSGLSRRVRIASPRYASLEPRCHRGSIYRVRQSTKADLSSSLGLPTYLPTYPPICPPRRASMQACAAAHPFCLPLYFLASELRARRTLDNSRDRQPLLITLQRRVLAVPPSVSTIFCEFKIPPPQVPTFSRVILFFTFYSKKFVRFITFFFFTHIIVIYLNNLTYYNIFI